MASERNLGPGVEPAPPPAESVSASDKLQILAAEQSSLVAARGMSWNEVFSRAGMYLSVLSGAVVALALVAQATEFGDGFRVFALLLLPVVLFIGVATSIRIDQANFEDVRLVLGMNRIRRAYVEVAPDLADRFVTGITDDEQSVYDTLGGDPSASAVVDVLASTTGMLLVVNAVVAAALGAVIALTLKFDTAVAVVAGIVSFVLFVAAMWWYGYRVFQRGLAQLRTRYGPGVQRTVGVPTPDA